MVLPCGLRACWSVPIVDDAGALLGTDQQALRPYDKAIGAYLVQRSDCSTSSTTTISRRAAAVPQLPSPMPIGTGSIAWVYASGRLGAAPGRSSRPVGSTSSTVP